MDRAHALSLYAAHKLAFYGCLGWIVKSTTYHLVNSVYLPTRKKIIFFGGLTVVLQQLIHSHVTDLLQ